MHNKCNVFESPQMHPYPHLTEKKLSSTKLVPGAKKAWELLITCLHFLMRLLICYLTLLPFKKAFYTFSPSALLFCTSFHFISTSELLLRGRLLPTVGSERRTVCRLGARSGGADIQPPEVPAVRVRHAVKCTGEMCQVGC